MQECSEGVTNFEGAKRKFERAGYKLPKLIFWNLRPDASDRLHGRAAASTPVTQHEVSSHNSLANPAIGGLLSMGLGIMPWYALHLRHCWLDLCHTE